MIKIGFNFIKKDEVPIYAVNAEEVLMAGVCVDAVFITGMGRRVFVALLPETKERWGLIGEAMSLAEEKGFKNGVVVVREKEIGFVSFGSLNLKDTGGPVVVLEETGTV
jgi:hypothetical protein